MAKAPGRRGRAGSGDLGYDTTRARPLGPLVRVGVGAVAYVAVTLLIFNTGTVEAAEETDAARLLGVQIAFIATALLSPFVVAIASVAVQRLTKSEKAPRFAVDPLFGAGDGKTRRGAEQQRAAAFALCERRFERLANPGWRRRSSRQSIDDHQSRTVTVAIVRLQVRQVDAAFAHDTAREALRTPALGPVAQILTPIIAPIIDHRDLIPFTVCERLQPVGDRVGRLTRERTPATVANDLADLSVEQTQVVERFGGVANGSSRGAPPAVGDGDRRRQTVDPFGRRLLQLFEKLALVR
ncbi:MAG: hypothetical protein DYH08_09205 [Actinobacteria bacterium ATB1]|nr:hypothetical protein [Actinobacteria bacterium ATB1]